MLLVLQIVGGIVLGILGLLLLVFFALKLFGRRMLRALGEMTADFKYLYVPPRLKLRPAKSVEWKDPVRVRDLGTDMRDLGFTDAGTFVSEQMDYIRIHGFAHEATQVYGVVYEHDKAGVWIDFVSEYENGDGLTHTTAPGGQLTDSPPGQTKVYDVTAAPVALYRRHLEERPTAGLKPARAAEFQEALETAYARSMDWRNARGGASEEELRRHVRAEGREPTDEEIQELRTMQLGQAVVGVDTVLGERFLNETTMSAAQWEEVEDRLVYVHDVLTPEMAAERLFASVGLDDDSEFELPRELEGLPARQVFAALNERQPADKRLEKIATVSGPVEADVYVGPVIEEDDEDY